MTKTPDDNSLLRVLVIDDQSHVRTLVREILKRMGITNVTDAADGHDALAAVTQPGGRFDLILCDLRMPERDGIETIRSFAALGLESAIAIMSVEEERVIETAGMLAEVQGLRMLGTIAKPVTAEKLEPILKRMREVPGQRVDDTVIAPDQDFKNAFKRTELFFLYQPKVWMRTGKFAGVEALVRWKHPELGLFQPASFVPAMEEDEHYNRALTDFTLRETIACAGRWHQAGRELGIAINLSVRAFDRLDLPERIESLARDAHVPHERITLEVKETQVTRNAIQMIDVATRLRLKGFRLSIDDFGTGQSGLSQLQKLPFNELKIDRSFVDGCSTSSSKRSVVEASLTLARNLKMTSVAEGIQQRPDWDLLDELGCNVMQGYFIARPMSEEGLEAWAAQWTLNYRGATLRT
jgi:EAL domain-containing protein (putative c-di-GMP-specific phosphodiesterase class I)/ActR/RegA family two-component response regulator